MKDFFDQLKSITDIFNAGRLIFYPFAGALAVIPFYLFARILIVSLQPELDAQLRRDLDSMAYSWWSQAGIVLAAIVVGFLIAVAGFSMLERTGGSLAQDLARENPNRNTSFTYNYPLLRQNKSEDYAAWLIAEYYRYVEIATYILLGAMAGLGLMTLYVLVFVLRQFADEAAAVTASAYVVLVLLVAACIFVKGYLWPELWMKRVIVPGLRSFLLAKRNLIEGVKVVDRAVLPFRPQGSAPVTPTGGPAGAGPATPVSP
jgi:hypothetical protein